MPDKQREPGSCMVCGKPSGERKLCYNCDKTPEAAAPVPVPERDIETFFQAPAPVLTPSDYLDIVRQPPLNKPPDAVLTQPGADELRTCLLLILDSIDYTSGACSLTEMVGACLPKEILERAKKAVKI